MRNEDTESYRLIFKLRHLCLHVFKDIHKHNAGYIGETHVNTRTATYVFPYSFKHIQAQMGPETDTFIKIYVNTQVHILLEVGHIKPPTSELL